MLKLVIVGTIATLATAIYHPVNNDLVADIKEKADTWTPFEVHENPLGKRSVHELMGLLATKIEAPDMTLPAPKTVVTVPASFDART